MSESAITLAEIQTAARRIAGAIAPAPTVAAPALSDLARAEIFLKLETQHRTGSFKERGALNKLFSLDASARRKGVVAMSAGNHGQGLAYHARRLGIAATIVMPEGTPFTKIERTDAFGAKVILRGSSLAAAHQAALAHAREKGCVFVHPYDDPAVIAGQGTIALELLAARSDFDDVVVPIGGGGLISGIAVALKALSPGIAIVGVQSALYPSMYRLIRGEEPGPPSELPTLAEGIAVKEPGELTSEIVRSLVSEIRLVDEAAIEGAILALGESQKLVVEGAGAAGLAAVLAAPDRFSGRRVAIIVSGGNMDSRLFASVLMRGLVREGRLVRLRAELPDVPGALSRISGVIGARGANIVEVHHQQLFHDVSVKRAELDIVVETQNRRHVAELIAALVAAGFPTRLLNGDGEPGGPA